MRVTICFFIFFLCLSAESCEVPTTAELSSFFEGSQLWTEVEGPDSFRLETHNPVFLHIGFDDLTTTSIRWGDKIISGSEISLCWRSPDKRGLVITRLFFRTTLTKVKPGLMKSWIPFDGDLYYRKQSEINGIPLAEKKIIQ